MKLAAIILPLLCAGCSLAGQSPENAQAELALEQSQAVATSYYADHGRLPDASTLTADSRKFLKDEGIKTDPLWTFSCFDKNTKSPTMFVLLRVEGPNIRSRTYGFDMPSDAFEAGRKIAAGGSAKK